MTTSNTPSSYGSVTKTFHWLTALLILSVIPLGIVANGMAYDTSEALARKALLFSIHKTLGVTIFFVALARILWAMRQIKPGSLNPDRRTEHWLAETVHWLLYGSLLLVPLTGWIHHAATTGFAPIWWPFGQNLPFVPKDDSVAGTFAGLHLVFERVLAASILLHVAGALKHHFVDKDATLRRMWFGQSNAPDVPPHHRASLPVISALTAWAIAIGLGGMIGAYGSHTNVAKAAELETVSSEWTVTEGIISITTTQFGNPVTGSFADWTASISFDPNIPQGKAGEVDVTIAIGSLTLGSVTAQALGPDYFDAETFPTANFKADLVMVPDGYEAQGELTIRDASVPVSFFFSPRIQDDTAEVSTMLTLNRIDFGVGANMPDESNLGFAVDVEIALTATQSQD